MDRAQGCIRLQKLIALQASSFTDRGGLACATAELESAHAVGLFDPVGVERAFLDIELAVFPQSANPVAVERERAYAVELFDPVGFERAFLDIELVASCCTGAHSSPNCLFHHLRRSRSRRPPVSVPFDEHTRRLAPTGTVG